MNDQSGTAQLRFFEETAIRLRQNGFTVEPIEDHHLPVCWKKGVYAASLTRAACCTDKRTWTVFGRRMRCKASSTPLK